MSYREYTDFFDNRFIEEIKESIKNGNTMEYKINENKAISYPEALENKEAMDTLLLYLNSHNPTYLVLKGKYIIDEIDLTTANMIAYVNHR